jgi:methionyl-tRNA formyltransferase
VGAELLIETLPRYLADELAPRPQPEAGVTYAPRLRKSDGLLAWERSALALERQVRAYDPWPGTFTFWEQRRFKVLEAAARPEWCGSAAPGTVIELPDGVGVATGEGALKLVRIQMAGKRPMRVEPFLQGHRDFVGSHLGSRDGSV